MRRLTWSENCAVRSRTNAASNSSYRYMAVLAEVLAIEARRRRAFGPDTLADAVGMDDALSKRDRFGFETVDAHGRLGRGDRRLLGFLVLGTEQPRLLQVF